MEKARPVFIQYLIAALAIYVIGTAFIMSDLYYKVGALEFAMDHITGKCPVKH
jgi:hypothetical protein